MSADTLMRAIEATKPEIFHGIPYALGLLVEHPRGLDYLKSAKIVTAAGARTPDELGDRLVYEGVSILVLSLERSWHSKDVFTPHPTIPDVWKYVTRLDDRVTLSNGEKVLPLPIEGRIRQDSLVREAVIVGVDRALPELLVFRASDDMSDEEFLNAIWPSIADANLRAEAFSQITREAVITLPSDVEYPRTDKGSIIRAQMYQKFADEIEAMYARLDDEQEGTFRLDVAEIEKFLKSTYEDISSVTLESVDTDLFTGGVDSLKAIQMRRIIQKTLDLDKQRLSSNVIYDQGSVSKLAEYLSTLGQGHINGNGAHANVEEEDTTLLMKNLITKYSDFGETVILTGATGSLGAHILAQAINSHHITKVYCLVRGSNPFERVLQSLKDRGLELTPKDNVHKIVALSSNFSQPGLGVGEETFETFKSESFEPHLAGLRNLLALSLAVHRSEPARLFFVSSISTAENTPTPAVIPDEPIENFNHAIDMGYAQSKLVGEHMVLNAARGGARSYVLRIGQIVGDKEYGFWNDSEYIPLMIRSALSLKALPALHERCSWIPMDMLATAILELDRTLRAAPRPGTINGTVPPVIYNMVNPHLFSWTELLEEIRAAGLEFETIQYGEWMERLRESASTGNEERNPAVKILDHFEQRYVLSDHASHNCANESGVNGSGINRSGGNEVLVLNGGVNGTKAHNSPVSEDFNIKSSPMSNINDGESYRPLKTPPTMEDNRATKYVYGVKRLLVTISVTLVMFLTLLDTTIIVTAIPKITTEFSSLSDVGWYGSAYLIASCSLQPVTGKMFSNFSLKYVFIAFLAVFEIGSAICGAAQSSNMLIAGRTIAGLGGSGLRNGALTIMSESIPLEERPPYFGVCMGIAMLGAVAGPLIGGAFTVSVSWRWCFYINLPIGGLATILLLAIQIPDSNKTKKPKSLSGILGALTKLDPGGFLLFSPVAVMLLMALEWGGSQYAWNSVTIIGLFCGAGAIAIVFLAWEYHAGEEAMIPFSMVRNRVVWSSCLVIWFLFGSMMVYSYYLPIWFQAVKGASSLQSGVDLLPLILSQVVASILSGGLVRKVGYYLPFVIACGILLTISAALMSTFEIDTTSGKWIGYQILGGFGQGLGLQMPYVAVQNVLTEENNAVALALLVFMQNFGGAILLAIAETVFSSKLVSEMAKHAPDVNVAIVEGAGASGFREVVQPALLGGVLKAYNAALTKEFYLAIACTAAMLVICWGMSWIDIAKVEKETTAQTQSSGDHQLEDWKNCHE
ncbi:hypothetical protein ZTR_07474 [Talaromyces verruculosus]|nr:hypothetical protein ZTR_07474 [Talaromyces verruculosus]